MLLQRSARVALVVSALAAVALAGCGDDDDGGGGAAPTKDEFVAQANELCRDFNDDIEAAPSDVEVDDLEAAEELITDRLVPGLRDAIEEIRDLGFPEGDEEELQGIFDDTEAILDEIEDDPSAAMEQDDPFEDVNQRLVDYGLTVCGEG